MKLQHWWKGLRHRFAARTRQEPGLRLQTLGIAKSDWGLLRQVLAPVAHSLGVRVALDEHQGDVVLVEQLFALSMSPQALAAWAEERPVAWVALSALGRVEAGSTQALIARNQLALKRQLQALKLVRRLSPRWQSSGWEQSHDDSNALSVPDTAPLSEPDTLEIDPPPLDAGRLRLVVHLLRGLNDPSMEPLTASYGPGAHLRVDFAMRLAKLDPLAQQHLRVRRALPDPKPEVQPGEDATVRELDETVWDIGIACGSFRLLGAAPDWWAQPLAASVSGGEEELVALELDITRFTRLPRYLDLARRILEAPQRTLTPVELQRQTGVTALDMRRFLQASLFLGLVHWVWPERPLR